TRIAGSPIDILVTEDDVEIAIAKADQLQLEGVQFVCVAIKIANVVPCDCDDVIDGIEIVIDEIRARRFPSWRRRCAAAASINIRPEWRNDRIVDTCVDDPWSVGTTWPVERDVAGVVDVKLEIRVPEEVQA